MGNPAGRWFVFVAGPMLALAIPTERGSVDDLRFSFILGRTPRSERQMILYVSYLLAFSNALIAALKAITSACVPPANIYRASGKYVRREHQFGQTNRTNLLKEVQRMMYDVKAPLVYVKCSKSIFNIL